MLTVSFLVYNLHPHIVTDSGEQDDVTKLYSLVLINYSLIKSPMCGHSVLKSMERPEAC